MNRLQTLFDDWIGPLLLAGLLFLIGCLGAGCVAASPERQAHRATAMVITTANAAMDVWFAYVDAEEKALVVLKASDPAAYMARRRALVLNEGKVATVWDTYVKAQKAAILGAAALGPGEAPPPADTAQLKAELIALVQSIIQTR